MSQSLVYFTSHHHIPIFFNFFSYVLNVLNVRPNSIPPLLLYIYLYVFKVLVYFIKSNTILQFFQLFFPTSSMSSTPSKFYTPSPTINLSMSSMSLFFTKSNTIFQFFQLFFLRPQCPQRPSKFYTPSPTINLSMSSKSWFILLSPTPYSQFFSTFFLRPQCPQRPSKFYTPLSYYKFIYVFKVLVYFIKSNTIFPNFFQLFSYVLNVLNVRPNSIPPLQL